MRESHMGSIITYGPLAVLLVHALLLSSTASAACLDSRGCEDANPSVPFADLSDCGAGTFAGTDNDTCVECPEGRTTEVWVLMPDGSPGCTVDTSAEDGEEVGEEDEDGEDSDDWLPSLAACKSTCTGTCPGIIWTEPAGPTSCVKCSAGMVWTLPSAASTYVHKRIETGAPSASQCEFCTDGLTLVNGDCKKTGVCSTIGPTPYYKASGDCLPCPAQEDVGTPVQFVLIVLLLGAASAGIWVTSGAPEQIMAQSGPSDQRRGSVVEVQAAADLGAAADHDEQTGSTIVTAAAGPLMESVLILLPTFQLMGTAFSCDFSWPNFIRDIGQWLKTLLVGNFAQVAAPECMFSYGQQKDDERFLATLGFKFAIFLVFALLFGTLAASGAAGLHGYGDRALCALAASYSMTLVLIATACFTAVDVTEMPDGSLALETLPSITSDTDDFFGVLIWGIIGLVVFLLLIPSALLWALHRMRKRGQMWSPTIQAQYGSLFLRYRPGCWWYEFAFMARRIALPAVAILSGQPVATCVISAFILVLALILHLHHKPYMSTGHKIICLPDTAAGLKYRHADDNASADTLSTPDKLEALCIGTLVAVYALGTICIGLKPEENSTGSLVVSVMGILVLTVPLVGVIYIQRQAGESWKDLSQAFCPDIKICCKLKDDQVHPYAPEEEAKDGP